MRIEANEYIRTSVPEPQKTTMSEYDDIPDEPVNLVHFKCETCVSVDPKGIAEYLFGGNKHLVVLHKGKNQNPHWHFQGELAVTMKQYCAKIASMAKGHSKKIAKPSSRPVKRAMNGVNELGYQYMLKEDPYVVVCSHGFTEAELEELHEKSKEAVDELKSQLLIVYRQIDFATATQVPKDLHTVARVMGFRHYADRSVLPPPQLPEVGAVPAV